MALETEAHVPIDLDDIDLAIVEQLSVNGRVSYREIGDRVGLSAPAVADRVRKLEQSGVVVGYQAIIDYEKLGFPLLAVIRLKAPRRTDDIDETLLPAQPEVIEANRVTGSESHVLRARLSGTVHLEELLHRLWAVGDSETHIVTSSPVPRRPMLLAKALGRHLRG